MHIIYIPLINIQFFVQHFQIKFKDFTHLYVQLNKCIKTIFSNKRIKSQFYIHTLLFDTSGHLSKVEINRAILSIKWTSFFTCTIKWKCAWQIGQNLTHPSKAYLSCPQCEVDTDLCLVHKQWSSTWDYWRHENLKMILLSYRIYSFAYNSILQKFIFFFNNNPSLKSQETHIHINEKVGHEQ